MGIVRLGEISMNIYNRLFMSNAFKNYNKIRCYISGNLEMAAPQKSLLVRYVFNEKWGDKVSNSGILVDSLSLTIPDFIQKEFKPFLGFC